MLLSVRKPHPAIAAALSTTPNIKAASLREIFAPALAKSQQDLLTESGKPDQVQINMTAFLIRHEQAIIEDLEASHAVHNILLAAAHRCKPLKEILASQKAAAALSAEPASAGPFADAA